MTPIEGEASAAVSHEVPRNSAGVDADSYGRVAIKIEGLRREFGGVHAVDGVSLALTEGATTALIGPNGAGKSTLLKLIGGALRPTAGRIEYAGHDVAGMAPHRIAQRGIIRTFQLSTEFSRLTVLENLLVAAPQARGATLFGAVRGKRYWRGQQTELVQTARSLAETFGLAAKLDAYAGELSGGQKRLLEMARAVMARPKVLLLDEPLAGVSPSLMQAVEEQIVALQEQGLTIIMVEHELGAVERVSHSAIVMARGKVLAHGTMRELRANQEVVDAFLGS